MTRIKRVHMRRSATKCAPSIEDRRACTERRQRLLGLGDQLSKPRLCAVGAEHIDHGGLAGPASLPVCLPTSAGIAFDVEQIVGDLEGLADAPRP